MNGREPHPRQSGRHRRGTAPEQVGSRPWDPAERAAAEQLDQVEPAWTVWYGPGTRHFHAVAGWPASEPLIVRARTADELRDLMREAEHSTPPPRGGTMPETPDTPHPPDPPYGPRASADRHLPDDPRTVYWDLPHDLPIVGKARAMAGETLTAWALHHLVDDVVLVVGELLANAIVHGEPVVRLSLWVSPDEFQVQVTDGHATSPWTPSPRTAAGWPSSGPSPTTPASSPSPTAPAKPSGPAGDCRREMSGPLPEPAGDPSCRRRRSRCLRYNAAHLEPPRKIVTIYPQMSK